MKTNIKIAVVGIIAVIVAVAIAACIIYEPVEVVIDPGHGGSDVGAEYNGRYEKDDNLAIALLVKEELKNMGISSHLTRETDKFVELKSRCNAANRRKAELFVSLHRNSAEGAKGVEIWVSDSEPKADVQLAQNIMDALDNAGISQNRGVKCGYARGDGNYYVNSHTDMPSCLVELGFINSEEDNEFFDKNLEAYAKAIAKAIAESLPER